MTCSIVPARGKGWAWAVVRAAPHISDIAAAVSVSFALISIPSPGGRSSGRPLQVRRAGCIVYGLCGNDLATSRSVKRLALEVAFAGGLLALAPGSLRAQGGPPLMKIGRASCRERAAVAGVHGRMKV